MVKSRCSYQYYWIAGKSSLIATDSIEQLSTYTPPHFLTNTPYVNSINELSDIVSGKTPGRKSMNDVTLFCSVGLSGTEVVVAHEIMKLANREQEHSFSSF